MRFSEILTENYDSCADAAAYIREHCQPWLSQSNGLSAYRGLGAGKPPIVVMPVRQNRQPKDTAPALQDLINQYLKQKGFEAQRHNSIFLTGNYNQAKAYGRIYLVFPKGEFQFTWSPKVKDLYLMLDWDTMFDHNCFGGEVADLDFKSILLKADEITSAMGGVDDVERKKAENDLLTSWLDPNRVFAYIDTFGYRNTDLSAALDSDNEVMVHCQEYMAVSFDRIENELYFPEKFFDLLKGN